ncbi:MAG: transcriptional coactivator p15/PC4 family protein [Clostridia bacterium]|nr:transcriptional coactivator p15/PC4 family protein [Clostridia bacterium]
MSDFWDKEEMIGKIAKNNREEIQIKKVEKKGKKYVDVRVFWLDGESGEFRPSQKGVTVAYESFSYFKELINSIPDND